MMCTKLLVEIPNPNTVLNFNETHRTPHDGPSNVLHQDDSAAGHNHSDAASTSVNREGSAAGHTQPGNDPLMHYNNQSDAASSNNIYVMESVFIIAVGAAENGAAEIGEQVAGHNSSSNIMHVM